MKPDDFRQLIIQPGTLIGLIGDYNGSEWSHSEQVQGNITDYIIVERHQPIAHNKEMGDVEWDTAALVSLPVPLQTLGYHSNLSTEEEYNGDKLLLIHRYPNFAWDNVDPTVHVFGIKHDTSLENSPLRLTAWRPKTIWLSSAAVMTVEDAPILSEYSRATHKSIEVKNFKKNWMPD